MTPSKYVRTHNYENTVLNQSVHESIIKFIEFVLGINLNTFKEHECNIIYYEQKDILIQKLHNVAFDAETFINIYKSIKYEHNCPSLFKNVGITHGIVTQIDFLIDYEDEKIYFIIFLDAIETMDVIKLTVQNKIFCFQEKNSSKVRICYIEDMDAIMEEVYLSV
jgi:hypothetical protein